MGILRTKMIEEMKLRNFSPRTEQSYVAAMVGLSRYYRRSPDQLTQDEIRCYLLHLQERGLSPSSRNVAISGLKFFYHQILDWDEQRSAELVRVRLALPKTALKSHGRVAIGEKPPALILTNIHWPDYR